MKLKKYFWMILLTAMIAPLSSRAEWSGPTQSPPNGNVSEPINVGTIAQIKNGGLSVNAFTAWSNAYFAGNVGVGISSPSYKLQVGSSGDGTAVGANAYYYISDKNLKSNVKTLDNALAGVMKLRGVSFDWKKTGEKSVGVIAQEVAEVYPELVNTDKVTGYKSVEYGNLVAPLIEAIKAQQKQIDELKSEIEILKAK